MKKERKQEERRAAAFTTISSAGASLKASLRSFPQRSEISPTGAVLQAASLETQVGHTRDLLKYPPGFFFG